MKLSELGEFGCIKRASEIVRQTLPAGVVGIGDDCAVIPIDSAKSLLVTTDMLVENIHFIREKIQPFELGYKSLAVNLSDIAAMGGDPQSAFISIAVPLNIEVEWMDEFYSGLKQLANSFGVYILGGDTTQSKNDIVVNITVLGIAQSHSIKYRSQATVGDCICVTDCIGDSGAGLKLILNNLEVDTDAHYLIQRHHLPRPQIQEGKWLASKSAVHAMMDVSDGVDSDIQRIMERSSCGAHIELERLPISQELRRVSEKYQWDPLLIAATGGEDYCLLVTVSQDEYEDIASEFEKTFGRKLQKIGTIMEQNFGLQYSLNRKIVQLQSHGYDHFIHTQDTPKNLPPS
ncbi:MAG: thiamine-phosphate kinase [Bacteroidetes bacterium]|jgi:thiamine-monophosphate kinase|nr:thiamine-phosphate kinase [Bacteroidota bacterium]